MDGSPLARVFFEVLRTGRCGRVFDLLMRRTKPLAIMPSAKTGPDRKHALEAPGESWVFPSSGFDRLSHYFMSALPNFVAAALAPGLLVMRRPVRDNARRWS